MVLGSLGELLRRRGETEEARRVLERAVRIAERPNADGVVNTWAATDAHQSLGNLCADLGLRALADEHFRRAIAGSEKIDKRVGLADCLEDYANYLGRSGRVSEAVAIRTRANRIRISLIEQTLVVRKLSAQARELADTYFFETLVRVHRAGEGAPFTGLKPAGRDLGPAIQAGAAAQHVE